MTGVWRRGAPARSRGFTLIEVLAAFVVFVLAFGAVMHALSGSLYNTVRSRHYTQAALLARTKMAGLGITRPIEPTTAQGEFDNGYRWKLEIHKLDQKIQAKTPGGNRAPAPRPPAPGRCGRRAGGLGLQPDLTLYEAVLTVSWGKGANRRQAEFRTLRVVRPEL